MRNFNKAVIAILLASTLSCVHAQTKAKLYSDVPVNHWAYKAIEDLTEKGLIVGFPNGTFRGSKPLTRYSFAVVVSRMLDRYAELTQNGNFVSKTDLKTIEDLVSEFINEIESISEDIKEIKSDVKELKSDVEKNKTDISELKENVNSKNDEIDSKLERLSKVKVNGDILFQNIDYQKTALNVDDYQNMQVRIGFNAKPSDKVEADFQYVAYDRDLDSNNDDNLKMNGPSKSTFGRAQGENKVEIAKVKVNKVFNDNDYIQVGRDFMTHGHGLVINDYADSITYNTKSGDVNISGNIIYADYDNGISQNKKGQQIWNLNADTSIKGHNIYAGLYQQNTKSYYDVTRDANGQITNADLQYKDRTKQIAEIGSSGNITNNGKVKYDVAMVASTNERKNMVNDGRKDKATGYMEHVAVTWDASDNLTAKAAYTTADEKFDGIISLDKNQSSIDGHTTPFDDIARFHNLLGGMLNDKFYNTSDLKLQLEYVFANKQSVRFAYDIVKENHKLAKSGFTPMGQNCDNWNMAGYNKLDAKISTLEYKYQFDPSTRLSLGYTNADKSDCRDETNQKMKDEQLFWTEIFSKF